MNNKHYYLTLLMEEASEVIQAASKLIRFDEIDKRNDSSNLEKLNLEFHDLYTVMEMLYSEFGKQLSIDSDKILSKRKKIDKYHQISKKIWANTHNDSIKNID